MHGGTGTDWAALSVGRFHTCGTQIDGSLWCWGDNETAQLGLGHTRNRWVPVEVGAETDWATLSAGGYRTCATRSDGAAWSWGYNRFGEVGDGTRHQRKGPVQVTDG
jgi:alpha-tubulin suppressor-like RCC1 family protein